MLTTNPANMPVADTINSRVDRLLSMIPDMARNKNVNRLII